MRATRANDIMLARRRQLELENNNKRTTFLRFYYYYYHHHHLRYYFIGFICQGGERREASSSIKTIISLGTFLRWHRRAMRVIRTDFAETEATIFFFYITTYTSIV